MPIESYRAEGGKLRARPLFLPLSLCFSLSLAPPDVPSLLRDSLGPFSITNDRAAPEGQRRCAARPVEFGRNSAPGRQARKSRAQTKRRGIN